MTYVWLMKKKKKSKLLLLTDSLTNFQLIVASRWAMIQLRTRPDVNSVVSKKISMEAKHVLFLDVVLVHFEQLKTMSNKFMRMHFNERILLLVSLKIKLELVSQQFCQMEISLTIGFHLNS